MTPAKNPPRGVWGCLAAFVLLVAASSFALGFGVALLTRTQ